MSSINQLATIDTALLTDLTVEQSAIVEGGLFLYIQGIQAVTAGADTFGADDTYVSYTDAMGKKTALSETGMSTGTYRNVNFGTPVFGTGSVQLFDSDWGRDDSLGGFRVTGPTNGQVVQRVSGSGSTYDVFYSVFA
jgi:hypothetical protein